jgi:hypothetical protein
VSYVTEHILVDDKGEPLDARDLKTDGTEYPMKVVACYWHPEKVSVLVMKYVVALDQAKPPTKVVPIQPASESNTPGE